MSALIASYSTTHKEEWYLLFCVAFTGIDMKLVCFNKWIVVVSIVSRRTALDNYSVSIKIEGHSYTEKLIDIRSCGTKHD